MSAWDLTRRGVAKPPAPIATPKHSHQSMPNDVLPSSQPAISYWRDQLLGLIESASRAGQQLPLNMETANLVHNLPLLLLADKQPTGSKPDQSLNVDPIASYCSRSFTPSPSTSTSTSSSHCNSAAENVPDSAQLQQPTGRAAHLLLPAKQVAAPTADSTFCSSLSSFSSRASSSCGDLSQQPNDSGSLGLQTPDRKARKKDQNRRAAFNYRRKKMEERDKMLEEEARLVHLHVRLAGKIARLDERIIALLKSKTSKTFKADGKPAGYLCPNCSKLCDTVPALRSHLKTKHFPQTISEARRSGSSQTPKSPMSQSPPGLMNIKESPKHSDSHPIDKHTDLERNNSLDPYAYRDKFVDAPCDSPNDVNDYEDEVDVESDDDIDCDNNNDCNL